MATPAEARQIQNAIILHNVQLRRLSLREVQIVWALLGRMEERLAGVLTERVLSGARGTWTTQRAAILRRAVEDLYRSTFREIYDRLTETTGRLGIYEATFNRELFETILATSLRLPPADVLARIGSQVPFEGKLLGRHLSDTARAHLAAVQGAVAEGFALGETGPQIIRRVLGDGSLPADELRRNAAAVTRTAMAHTSGKSASATYRLNPDTLEGEVWVSTLDGRTTLVCQGNSGAVRVYVYDDTGAPDPGAETWSNGYEGEYPAHFGERSILSPWVRGTDPELATPTNYEEWLSEQPEAVQDEILGPSRARLWRDGKVELGAFTDPEGRVLSLDDLAKQEGVALPS